MKFLTAGCIHDNWNVFKPLLETQIINYSPDYLLFTGDLTNYGVKNSKNLNKLVEVLQDLEKRIPIVMCFGNHDLGLGPSYFSGILKNTKILENEAWYDSRTGLNFWGGALSTAYNLPALAERWDYMTISREYERSYFEQIPDNVDILITHSPPSGKLGTMENGVDVGSRELRRQLKSGRISPAFNAHSHIHNNGGLVEIINKIPCHNVSLMTKIIEI